ncbi:MAG TPA: zinc ribbon domain-containing protein, partial [Flavobacterium sp.]|nr:zinc ribbon domain-containing protein [Flavobacterium sp.]
NECGIKDGKSRVSQSEFACTSCGHVSNADINAAKNIMSKGIAFNRKREPLGCALVEEPDIMGMSASKEEESDLHLKSKQQ